MRALRVLIALLLFGSAFTWSDTIYTVNIWANFTAKSTMRHQLHRNDRRQLQIRLGRLCA